MSALPSLHGSIGYIFTTCDLDIKSSKNVRVKDIVDRFRVYDQPRRLEGKPEEWLAGERVDTRGMSVLDYQFTAGAEQIWDRLSFVRQDIRPHRSLRSDLFDSTQLNAPGSGRSHLRPTTAFAQR